MKKFAGAVIFLGLIVGLICFVIFSNSSAMLTIFTQDQDKIEILAQNAINGVSNHDHYYFRTTYRIDNEDGSYVLLEGDVQLVKNEDDAYNFIGSSDYTYYYKNTSTSDPDDFTTETGKIDSYYVDGNLYKKTTENETETKTKDEGVSFDEAISSITGVGSEMIFPELEDSFWDDVEKYSSDIKMKFSPFYLGEKFKMELNEGDLYAYVSLFGNLKQLEFIVTSEEDENTMTCITEYINNNNFTLNFPSDLTSYGV